MGKITAAAVLFAGLGFLAGRLSSPDAPVQQETEPVPTAATQEPAACEKFQTMYDRLRADYIKLQDENRLASAATGVCTPPPETRDIPPAPVAPPKVAEATPPEDVASAVEADESADETATAGNSTMPQTGSELSVIMSDAVATESAWSKADTPAKKKKFLDRVRLKNAMKTIDGMPPVTAKDKFYSDLHGNFKGPIRFLEKDRKNGRISLLVRKPEDADPPHPKAWLVRVDIDDGMGKVTRQTGGIDMLRTTGDKSSAFSIRSSETSYLQMFYQESTDEFIGNYYEKNSKGAYPKRGTITLKRQAN